MSKVQCLSCGGMADLGSAVEGDCPYCGNTVMLRRISSFAMINLPEVMQIKNLLECPDTESRQNKNLPLGLCYLKIGNCELARKKFGQVIEESPECCEAYFYYSVTMLHGKRLESITLQEARKATEYLKTAIALDEHFPFPKLLYGLLCIEYYQANDLIPPANGIRILQELSNQEIEEQEFLFFKQMINSQIIGNL